MTMHGLFAARPLPSVVILSVLLALPGCRIRDWLISDRSDPPPAVLARDATLAEITDHLNVERSRLMAWRSNDVRISASGKGMLTPKLDANLSVESPRNLRLVATSIRGREVDFGSNSDRFWFWTRAEQPDIILTGSHDGLAQQQVLQLPFPPSWLMETLGVVPLDTTRVQVLREEASPDQVQLISNQVIEGRPVQRVMIVDLLQGQIVQHALFDQQSQLICSARMSDFRRPVGDESNSRLPHRIDLNWPRSDMKLTMKMREIEVNPQFNSHTWKLLQDPSCRLIDLDSIPPRR